MPGFVVVALIGSDQHSARGVQCHSVVQRVKQVVLIAQGQVKGGGIGFWTGQGAVADVQKVQQVVLRVGR